MKYPYERLLLFLVSRKADVDKALARYGLPEVGVYWVASRRTDIRNSSPRSVATYLESDDEAPLVARDGFLEWADSEYIRPLWDIQQEFGGAEPSRELDTAYQIFVNPLIRAVAGMLLLSQATVSEITELLLRQFNIDADEKTLDLYATIFWDIDLPGKSGWESFVGTLKTKEERHYIGLGLSSPTIGDIRRYLGLAPAHAPEDILTQIMSKSHERFTSAMEQPNPENDGARGWAELSIKAINALANTQKSLGAAADALKPDDFGKMFGVQIEKIEHVSLAELQGHVSVKKDAGPKETE